MRSALVALAMSSALTGTANASTIDVPVILRDFRITHPDFQWFISGLVTGLVSPVLPSSRIPDFVAAPGSGAINNAATFAQWYRDVPGVNTTYPFTLTLTETAPGIYTYTNTSFFPLNALTPRSVWDHPSNNYYFTLEMRREFTYQRGQFFTFIGDDDLWVYIDDRLVIDLGGVHPPRFGSVNLDTLGLIPGRSYKFDLFFAERHTSLSTFQVQTSLVLRPPVPAPASLALFGLGVLAIAATRRTAAR